MWSRNPINSHIDPPQGSRVTLGDGRGATVVENNRNSGTIWVRDDNGYRYAANKGSGWAGSGNWAEDIPKSE